MADHPIQGLMKTAMENIKEMVDVNTIVGDPVETPDGSVIMPISKVGFGFAAGGSEFSVESDGDQGQGQGQGRTDAHNAHVALPFGGGSGGGVSITPIAFLVVGKQGVKVVPLDNQTHLYERLIDQAPQVVDKIQNMLRSNRNQNAAMNANMMPNAAMNTNMAPNAAATNTIFTTNPSNVID
ncbi:sporulation protein YtfJ [Paenibacillus mesophilus]|uniref:GerW family sporulation protein n=1 Tax=Paenibacillus mesophilus TaxID=2582849 RepID=UPI00110DF9D2|nr:GerW family sporulation protein [Paenibacillus mesophilus]TMV51339.1 sporulation protein YtfJ [Paenibacillus mesophilus]